MSLGHRLALLHHCLPCQILRILTVRILMTMDKLFIENGKKSSVPYYLSLMDKTRAATLQRKIANIPQVKDDEL